MEKLTKTQIEELKTAHGDIFLIDVEDKSCILRRPTRKDMSMATKMSTQDPMKFNEIIINNCWIQGDEEIKTVDSYFLGASGQVSELIEIKEASIKKL